MSLAFWLLWAGMFVMFAVAIAHLMFGPHHVHGPLPGPESYAATGWVDNPWVPHHHERVTHAHGGIEGSHIHGRGGKPIPKP